MLSNSDTTFSNFLGFNQEFYDIQCEVIKALDVIGYNVNATSEWTKGNICAVLSYSAQNHLQDVLSLGESDIPVLAHIPDGQVNNFGNIETHSGIYYLYGLKKGALKIIETEQYGIEFQSPKAVRSSWIIEFPDDLLFRKEGGTIPSLQTHYPQ